MSLNKTYKLEIDCFMWLVKKNKSYFVFVLTAVRINEAQSLIKMIKISMAFIDCVIKSYI